MTELWKLSARDIATAVKKGECSATEATESTLERIEAVNSSVNAIIDYFPEESLQSARDLDSRLARGETGGVLAGVPVTVKVNIDQRDHATTNGLQIQEKLIASQDSPVVSNLRKSGAIIVGRTNTPAFSIRWFCRNSLHGHTLNPRNPALTPGGSSGGAASAVTAGMGAIGHGTDIGGSIRYPAYACGIHGLRPTLGRIPAWNATGPDRHIGAQLMAVSGPLARNMDDIELGLHAMSLADYRDPWWTPVPLELEPQPKKVAFCPAPDGMKVDPIAVEAVHKAAKALEDAGWQVEETDGPGFERARELQLMLWLSEYAFTGTGAIDRENDADASFIFEQLRSHCSNLNMNTLLGALQERVGLVRQWSQFLDAYPVFLCPVSGELPFKDMGDLTSPERFSEILDAQHIQLGLPTLGLPGLAVTTDISSPIPVGVQLIGGKFREDTLIKAGRAIEQSGPVINAIDPVKAE